VSILWSLHKRPQIRPDIVDLVLAEHRGIRAQLDAFPEVSDQDRSEAFDSLVAEIVAHEECERLVLYPAVQSLVAGGAAIARDLLEEQVEAERHLHAMEKTPIEDAEFDSLFRRLERRLRDHADAEEKHAIWAVLAQTDSESRRRLGSRYQRARRRVPLRPHPVLSSAAHLPAPLATAGRVSDRLRRSVHRSQAPSRTATRAAPHRGADLGSIVSSWHRTLDRQLRTLEALAELAPRAALEELTARFSMLTGAELEVLYPALHKHRPEGVDMAKQARLDHEEVLVSLKRLQSSAVPVTEFRTELGHVVAVLRAHIDEERQSMIPLIEREATQEELAVLGREFVAALRRAPRQPHPRSLKSGLGARASNSVLARLERLFGRSAPEARVG